MRNSLLPLAVAIILGLAAAFFAKNWMRDRIEAVEAERRNGVQVVIATADVSFGQKFGSESVTLVGWPRDSVPTGAYHDVADVVGKIANQKIVAGEAILKSRTVGQSGGSSLAALIEPSKRAVTVRVNDVIGVAGFLLPGNRVDVLATRELERNKAVTRTLLQNVKVLAVDQTAAPDKDKPVVVRAVTLEVEPRQAELLVQATEEGSVQMALRNPEETPPSVQTATLEDPVPKPRVIVIREPAAAAPQQAPPPPGVTVIRQTQVGESSGN
ncbi:MAG TPA: Flp pilus assembly protein CpaB [Verrucomicrobiae bacterium]|nr:Flp pilus assembly protein CpaB [Verrucomicrobiae bacterium]